MVIQNRMNVNKILYLGLQYADYMLCETEVLFDNILDC